MTEIVIGGQRRTLLYNSHAIGELELRSQTHVGWFLGELYLEGRCGFAVAVWLVWAGLLHEPRPPRREDIEAALDAAMKDGQKPVDWRAPIVTALDAFLGSKKKTAAEGGSPSTPSTTPTGSRRTAPSSSRRATSRGTSDG